MEEATVLEDLFLFLPDRSTRPGAIAFSPSGIIAVGEKSTVRMKAGPKPRIISLPGALVLPGFCDSHTHMIWGALQRARVDLRSAKSRGDIGRRIQDWMKETPSPWISGNGEAWAVNSDRTNDGVTAGPQPPDPTCKRAGKLRALRSLASIWHPTRGGNCPRFLHRFPTEFAENAMESVVARFRRRPEERRALRLLCIGALFA
jgi:hypothetical protein